ncbi:phosphohistidine phosphatase [Capsulimonas corticalis]|uniref:Phosphohistidine phosphatase n=1 Tax=Capsulimonas corticalis TaxID=2219043 RepID=A0A402CQV9_9BACT|nr:histidine phosphatase family protein [Capsulimonas corticalis]BDI34431.1 phosphohistidine phosphatase [Capsulimonas corticalis]
MKTLFLLRHGKAEAHAPGGDADRDLTERGEADIRKIGRHLTALGGRPDCVVTSGARRARRTAQIAASASGYTEEIVTASSIYEATVGTLLLVVNTLPAEKSRVLMVGHNPGFEELADLLALPGGAAVHMPTATLAHLEFDVNDWLNVIPASGRLIGIYLAQNIA